MALCFGFLLVSAPFLLSQNSKSFLLLGVIIWCLERIGVRNLWWLRVVFPSILSSVLSTHSNGILVWWVEGKLHCPLPIRNTLVLVPPNFLVAANPLQANLSRAISFFGWSVIAHFHTNGFGNSSGIVDFLSFASFAFLLRGLR